MITGWGAGAWSEGAWGSDPTEVVGVEATFAVNDVTLQVTSSIGVVGVSAAFLISPVSALSSATAVVRGVEAKFSAGVIRFWRPLITGGAKPWVPIPTGVPPFDTVESWQPVVTTSSRPWATLPD